MNGRMVGNFEIVSPLGHGGMGEVWLAQQTTLKTKAAIKILAANISNNPQHVARFHNEALAVSQIPHSGIVKIFDSGMLGDRAYLVMEYLQGETLAGRIKRMQRLEIQQLCDFGRQIASVLDATHGAGITHRDLKPENIFLVRDTEMVHGERIKVLDFGIAKLETAVGPRMTSASASSIGTPNYMSPEQWHSLAESDWRTDAYALGCVAFEMACGRPPFVAASRVEVCAMHLESPPPVPSSIRPGLPPAFDVLIAKLLDKDPAKRPAMREVMGAFTALGEQAGVMLSTLPPTGMRSPLAPPVNKKPIALFAFIGVVLAGAVIAFVATRSKSAPQGLPARTEPAQLPALTTALDVVVCIDDTGEVTSVRTPNGATVDNAVEAKVLTWSYPPGTKACGPVTIPANAAAAGALPERFTQKLFDNAVGAVHEAIFDCAEVGSGTFTVEVSVAPDGTGKITKLGLPPGNEKFETCIREAVSKAPFAKTKLGGKGKTTVQLGG